MRHLLATALLPAVLVLGACSEPPPSSEPSESSETPTSATPEPSSPSPRPDGRVDLIRKNAPTWDYYTDEEIVRFLDRACRTGTVLNKEARIGGVNLHDQGYLIGLAMSMCEEPSGTPQG